MIHQYKLNGYNIVLDVYSGSVHLVDEVAYDIIALYETTPQEEIVAQMLAKYGHRDDVDEGEILDCLADIQALKQAASSSPKTCGRTWSRRPSNTPSPCSRPCACTWPTPATSTATTALPARGTTTGTGAVPFAVGKQALDFLIASSGSRVNLEVDFFGASP